MDHFERLNKIADDAGLPRLNSGWPTPTYVSHALDLLCLASGLLTAEELRAHYSRASETEAKPKTSFPWFT